MGEDIDPSWAKGPLGRCLGELPLRYARVALVADLSAGGPRLFNGTATLIELAGVKLAVTCYHVLDKYRELGLSGRTALFQVGKVRLEPFEQLIAEDREMDLATIRFSEEQAKLLEDEGATFLMPPRWPPGPLTEEDWVSLGGFPGTLREHVELNVLNCPSYSVGATPVTLRQRRRSGVVSSGTGGCGAREARGSWTQIVSAA